MALRRIAVARSSPSGSGPRMRSSCATAPSVRAVAIVLAFVSVQPYVTLGTTAFGLNTANADATSSPGT